METLNFNGRIALVTGAGGGIGRCHALELARRGARVVVNDLGTTVDGSGGSRGEASAAQRVVDEIAAAGGTAVANSDSVATPDGAAGAVGAAVDAFGRIDVVVNNAGILRDASFRNMTPELLEPVIDVHLKGTFYVTHAAWAHFREQGYGRVVNTSSGSGVFGNFGQANYGAAKMGVVGLTHVLAIEGARSGITANAIAPIARTRMTEAVMGERGAALDPELISPLVAYLAHESCTRSGHIYSVGGGRVRRVFIGLTPGVEDRSLTTESIAASIDDIDSTDGFAVRAGLYGQS